MKLDIFLLQAFFVVQNTQKMFKKIKQVYKLNIKTGKTLEF